MILGTPTHIKQVLRDSNIYSTFVDNIVDEAKKQTKGTQANNSLPTNDPVFLKDVKKTFTPQFLQSSAENVIDGTYHWLTGKTSQPDFRIDLRSQKQGLANFLGDHAIDTLQALPVCTKAQLVQMNGSQLDPFKATCKPPGLDVNAEKQRVVNEVLNNPDFLKNTVITANTLPKDKHGDNIFQRQSFIPKIYGWVNFSPIILGVILLLLAAAIVFLHKTKRRGFRSIGFMLAETGVFLGIISFVSALFYQSLSKPGGKIHKALGQSGFQQTISKVMSSFMQLINNRLVIFGLTYAIIGSAILAALYFTRDKNKPQNVPEQKPTVDEPAIKKPGPEPPKKIIS